MKMTKMAVLVGFSVLAILAAFSSVTAGSGEREAEEGLETRVFGVRMLALDPEERAEMIEKLIDALHETCPDDSWNRGDIRSLDAAVVVRQTPENLEKIERMIHQLREAGGRRDHPLRDHEARAEMLEATNEMTSDPMIMGLLAVQGYREILGLEPMDVAVHLAEVLSRTETLALRNAIRVVLHDLYRQTEKFVASLDAMLAENDAAAKVENDDDDEHDDDDENHDEE